MGGDFPGGNFPRVNFPRTMLERSKLYNCHYFLLCFSLQQIWTDSRKMLIKFSTFVKLDECGSIRTYWRNMCQILKKR